uniref:hypothetical protein n=1 Tax=Acinetobacter sp. CFCC 10889 TaxID=1775557 RepID=UPI001BC88114
PAEGKNAIPMNMVEQIASNTLAGVMPHQFQRGLVLLSTSGKTFMPSFAEFRTLCIGQDWWNTEKAWVKACEYTKIIEHKAIEIEKGVFQFQEITTIAKFALDQVSLLIADGEMHRAKDEFVRLYGEYLAEAQLKGRVQEWYQEPKQLTWDNEQEKRVEHKPISNLEAQERLNALKQKMNVRNRNISKPQELKPSAKPLNTPIINEWPDPFDQPEEYLKQCQLDGCAVPATIRKQLGGPYV